MVLVSFYFLSFLDLHTGCHQKMLFKHVTLLDGADQHILLCRPLFAENPQYLAPFEGGIPNIVA